MEIRESGTLEELRAHLRGPRPRCVVLEPADGEGRLDPAPARAVREVDGEVPLILWTRLSATAVADLLKEVGGTWLRKGCGRRRLTSRIERALERTSPRGSGRASPASEPERIHPFQPEPRF